MQASSATTIRLRKLREMKALDLRRKWRNFANYVIYMVLENIRIVGVSPSNYSCNLKFKYVSEEAVLQSQQNKMLQLETDPSAFLA